jgi:hypothetical protein
MIVVRSHIRCPRHILLAALLCLIGAGGVCAQVLATRNWEGSGVTVEPWWRRAVFYRIDLATFQDSDGDGKGDYAGLTQRLDYLQSLGVDAVILKAGATPLPMDGFDDLARAAVESHVRILVELGAPRSQADDDRYVAEARQWLNQGAAGLYVPTPLLEKVDGANHIALLMHQLRLVTNGFPGGRVLLADAPASANEDDLARALAKEAQLTASPALAAPASGNVAASLRAQLAAAEGPVTPSTDSASGGSSRRRRRVAVVAESNPLLVAGRVGGEMDPTTRAGLQRALAVMLLASRAAVLIDYGQELGSEAEGGRDPLMQWTPTNLTQKQVAQDQASKPATPSTTYQTFDAYIQPLRKDFFPPPKMPVVTESDDAVPAVVDPNTLPGFTAGTLDASLLSPNGATANVANEQASSRSLWNLYRQLIQLHHENATVRNGSQTMLDFDAAGAIVWERHAPASSRTSVNVVVACNLSDKPVALGDLGKGLRGVVGVVNAGTMAPGGAVVAEVLRGRESDGRSIRR